MTQAFRLIPRDLIQALPDGRHVGRHGPHACHSAFQPIVSPALMRTVGLEGLLRVSLDGRPVAPTEFFASLDEDGLREACRLARALHVLNAPLVPGGNEWLFLNVHPAAIRRRRASADQVAAELATQGMQPARIVLEVVESAPLEDTELADFVREFRAAGFRIAIDDFGAGASNYDRVLGVQPDIIKLDRSLIANAAASSRARRLFPHMVALLREAGSLVVVEGIETPEQAQIAIDADAELLQGYFFAQPAEGAPDPQHCRAHLEQVLLAPQTVTARRNGAESFRSRFLDCWTAFRDGRPLELIAQDIADPQITRLYVLDNRGFQIGDTALTRNALLGIDHPLSNARGACWSRRHYFRAAMEQPGRIQLTRPYLSLTEQRLCATYSCATSHRALGSCVVCMDVLLEE
jgi:EAL domain-containing protein (putative c-di-GMP-specific phosphodiesterase class I)